jgi:hypothetical protein
MNSIHTFLVKLDVSNKDVEDTRKKLKSKLSDWLDNISFLTGENETVILVETMDIEEKT